MDEPACNYRVTHEVDIVNIIASRRLPETSHENRSRGHESRNSRTGDMLDETQKE